MASSDRRQREKEDLRAQILEAARRIVLKEGFGALSMRKLAEAVEYAPGTLYLYFKDRDDLARQLAARSLGELHAHVSTRATARDPARRIQQIGRAYIEYALAHPESYRLVFMESPELAEGTMEREGDPGRQALAMLAEAVTELRGIGGVESQRLAEALWAAVHGVASLKLVSPHFPETPAEEWGDRVVRTLLAGIQATASRGRR